MARGFRTIALACAASGVPSVASACVCVNEPVTVALAEGRVFTLDGPSGPEAIPEATVELHTVREHVKVSGATTDADGNFTLPTPPPGEYSLRVSLSGFRSTVITVRIKKGRPGAGGRLVVRLDMPGDCTCGDARVSKSDKSGHLVPKCLMERSRVRSVRVQPPNKRLKLTAARRQAGRAAAA
jgi:hypothetical protein